MGIRLRNRQVGIDVVPISGTLWYRPPGTPIGGPAEVAVPTGPHNCIQSIDSIDDSVGSPSSYNPVTHTSLAFHRWDWPKGWTDFNEVRLSTPAPIILGLNELDDIVPENWDINSSAHLDFCTQAFSALTEQMPPVIDGLHFIQDMKDLGHLLKSIRRNFENLYSLSHSVRQSAIWGRHAGNPLGEIFRQISNGHLTYLFGIKPLIREVQDFGSGIGLLFERLRFLRSTVGQSFTTRYKKSHSFQWRDETYFTGGVPGALQYWRARPISGHITYNSQMLIKNELVGLEDFLSTLKSLLAGIGFTKVASFGWDLIPFSFLFDWFVPVGQLLDRYATISPFKGDLIVLDAGHSCKGAFSWDIFFHPAPNYGNPEQRLGRLVYKQYARRRGLPANAGTLLSGDLTVQQLAIIGSLVGQRAFR